MGRSQENSSYRLLGFEKSNSLALVMVVSTGRIIKIKLAELMKSEVMDNFNKVEIKDVYRKFYSGGSALTAYEFADRHERSWMTYVALNLMLFALYIFTNVAAAKFVYLEYFDIVVTPGVFLYPLTFLIVDLLNESYGLRLARRAIFFAFASNAFILVLLSVTGFLPGLPTWELDGSYNKVIGHVSSALVASSVSFLFSEYVNSYLLCKIKELTSSRFLFLRVFFSTFFAVIIDSFIFCFIAFYGSMENDEILNIVYVQIAIKMCFAVFNVLPAYGARSLFKKYVAGAQAA
ncbi:putative integral membrane protein [Pseudomonas sp. GM78]|uniref:queuosine precursor transporter n=1 Tax=Pseudomonas sp. GM78 TaxID=1144337 RepID=UPI00026FA04F|nr:queuosine precursor transporter [Pseudomonas sp. GM78]EJN31506.1 putative integral membrane protein [Pseudomonas sp. GM78]